MSATSPDEAATGAAAATREAVIGLEVHVQLDTVSKLFCRCRSRFGAPPNTDICPVCTGQPGSLPVLNEDALRRGVLACLALGSVVDDTTAFDRKNYAYPDLPKGYQITQVARPLGRGGRLTYHLPDGAARTLTLERLHLEEDAGKTLHPPEEAVSLVDLNRAGRPLLEVVTAPTITSPAEAVAALRALRRLLRHAGVARCDMEKGAFRCDVNVSLRGADGAPGTRTEVKNLNSFRFVGGALEAELTRQGALLDAGEEVRSETLGYAPDTGRTHALRDKEAGRDYRVFPEPDLPPVALDPAWVAALGETIPELPEARRARYVETLGLPPRDADALLDEPGLALLFDEAVERTGLPKPTANWTLVELRRLASERGCAVDALSLSAERLAELVTLVDAGAVSVGVARELAAALEERPELTARELAEERDLLQVTDEAALRTVVEAVVARETELVERYRGGHPGPLDALLGAALAETGGRGAPRTLRRLLEERLGPPGA